MSPGRRDRASTRSFSANLSKSREERLVIGIDRWIILSLAGSFLSTPAAPSRLPS